MTFTEISFELADPLHPLCKLTINDKGHAVYRILDQGEFSRRHRAHLTILSASEAAASLVDELRTHPETTIEVLNGDAHSTSIALDEPLDPVGSGLRLSTVAPMMQAHGMHVLLDPVVASHGRLKFRAVVPRKTDTQEVVRLLQETQRACGFPEFRVGRIGPLSPSAHVEMARRTLPPSHEALLALASSMGYYATPKGVTLEEIARSVGLSISPVHKRLKAAEEAIVAQHVADGALDDPSRRSRAPVGVAENGGPWEIRIQVRNVLGPAAVLAHVPGARASVHMLSADGARAQSSILVVVAPEDAQAKLLSAIEDRAEITSREVIERSPHHAVCRLTTRDRGSYALSWWSETWGNDASLRAIVYQGGEIHVRALLARPHSKQHLHERLEATARAAGWSEWEVVSIRSLSQGLPPPTWPAPLTQRQVEVVRVAHALGYYRTPRECTLEHVANTLGVSANAVHKNLVLAESKLISSYLASGL